MSEYGLQLREKQKAKFIYGVLEKPFRNYYKKADQMPGMTGSNLMAMLEMRLDNVIFRLGFARTRREARQIVDHKHVLVNGKQVNIPSYLVKAGDQIEIKEAKKSSKLRIYAAGSMANITLAVIALLIVSAVGSYVIPSTFEEHGIEIDRLVGDSPASKVLKEGMVIESIDNHKVHDSNSYVNAVNNLKPGQNITIGTNEGDYSIVLDKNPNNESKGYMGIQAAKHYELNDGVASTYGDSLPWIWFNILELFQWIFMLNLGIGLFNLLPIKPLDGGHMFETLLSYKVSEKYYKPITNSLSLVLGMIIIFSLVYGFL